MNKNMLDVFIEKIQNYSHLNSNQNFNVKNIFMQGEGIYILDEPPSVDIIRQFPDFKGEFGLLLINNIWFLTVSTQKSTYIPAELDSYISKGLVQFFAHSHPNDGTTANIFPSFPDLISSDAIDHKFYIISAYGITEVEITDAKELKFLDERFTNYVYDNHISYEDYQQNQFKYYMNFIESIGCKLKIISFDNKKKINEILKSKKLLQHDFWNKMAGTASYPGRKL